MDLNLLKNKIQEYVDETHSYVSTNENEAKYQKSYKEELKVVSSKTLEILDSNPNEDVIVSKLFFSSTSYKDALVERKQLLFENKLQNDQDLRARINAKVDFFSFLENHFSNFF